MAGLNINPVSAIGDSLANVLEKVDGLITSKEESQELDVQMASVRNELASIQKDILLATAEVEKKLYDVKGNVLTAEIGGNVLQRNWRPIVMLSFALVVMYQFFFRDLINAIFKWCCTAAECFQLPLIDMPDHFWTLLEVGIGGYVAGRSLEKIAPNVARTVMEAKESRRITEEIAMKTEAKEKQREQRHERIMDRRDRRDEKRDEREARRREKAEEKENRLIGGTDITDVTKKEKRKLKRQQRREEGKSKMKKFFKR